MQDQHKTKTQLLNELAELKARDAERRQTEEALRESEHRFRSLVEGSSDSIALTDEQGVIVEWNQSTEQVTGLKRQDVIGRSLWDVMFSLLPQERQSPSHHERYRAILLEALRTGQSPVFGQVMEVAYRCADGARRVMQQRSFPIKTEQGFRIGTILRDVTERKQAEELVRIQRDLGMALSSTSDLMLALSRILDAALEIEGIDCGAVYLVDSSNGELDLVTHRGPLPDFVERTSHYAADSPQARLVAAGKPTYSRYSETRLATDETRRREGLRALAVIPVRRERQVVAGLNLASHTHDELAASVRSALEAIATQTENTLVRIRTETALRESQENLQTLFDTVDDYLFILDSEGRIVQTNPAAQKRLGYLAQELNGMHVLDVHPTDRREEAAEIIAAMLAGRVSACPIPLIAKDGTLVPVETKVTRGKWGGRGALFGISRDITERKQADEALRKSEAMLTSIFRAAPTGIGLVSNRVILAVNDRICEMVGRSREELLGQSARVLYPTDEEFEYVGREKYAQIRKEGTGTVETRWQHRDGAIMDVLLSLTPLDPDNLAAGITFTALDITERKQAEKEIRRQNEYLAALHETTLGVMGHLEITKLLEAIVERATKLVSASEGWLHLVTPDKTEIESMVETGQYRKHIGLRLKPGEGLSGRVWQSGQSLAVEDYYAWAGRSLKYSDDQLGPVIGVPLKFGSEVVGVIGLTRTPPAPSFSQDEIDLMSRFAHLASIALENARLHATLQKELDERVRTQEALQERLAFEQLITTISTEFINLAHDQIDVGIQQALQTIGEFTDSDRSYVILFSADGTQMDHMHEWCRVGITPLQSVYHEQPIGLLPWTTAKIKQSQVVHINFNNLPLEAQVDRELVQSRADPPLSLINVPMIYRGQVVGLLGFKSVRAEKTWSEDSIALLRIVGEIFVNALEHKRAQETIQSAYQTLEQRVEERTAQLEAANQELEAFAYSVSHDLRAPLRGIDGFGRALLQDYADRLDDPGQHYLRRIHTATQQMSQLIDDLLKLSRVTRSEMRRGPVNLSALAQAIAAELQATRPERQVEWSIAPELVVNADAHLMRILLANLLGNAYKFTAKHSTARIEFGVIEQEGQPIYFVHDDGAGFDITYADKLFGAFQRLHSPDEFEGTGIGLATVQRIVHRHGGRVWAEGAVEQGAAVYFTLP